MMLAATVDNNGAPRAFVLHGAPGFVASPDPLTLSIATDVQLAPGQPVGLLGLDFATRRRNRANGKVRASADGMLTVDVLESFGNCPQFITLRDVYWVEPQSRPAVAFDGLSDAARAFVARSDTFFVATSGGKHGVDISHRGGPRGFAAIEGNTLVIPDFKGNRYFNTLGNMLIDNRVALLFIDFASGDVLELRGTSAIEWKGDAEGGRHWRFSCEGGTIQRAALALRWRDRA
jgi:predicted pyridoxine 5'-phosphate oxidase superfamily flavin-nucleotide-binding protein